MKRLTRTIRPFCAGRIAIWNIFPCFWKAAGYAEDGPRNGRAAVDQRRIVELLEKLEIVPRLIQCVRGGFDDFDKHVADAVRASVERARPKFVNLRVLERLSLEFKQSDPARLIDNPNKDLTYLLVGGQDFDVGVRAKKLNRNGLSSNHRSRQQDRLRQDQRFLEYDNDKPRAHVFLGYRWRGGLQPALTCISLSSESQDECGRRHREWLHILWTEADGAANIRQIQSEFLPPPSPARVVPKRPASGDGDVNQQGG